MKLGSLDVSKLYLGSTEVTKAYLGGQVVFDLENIFVGLSVASNEASDTSITLAAPTHEVGDILISVLTNRTATPPSLPSTYTNILTATGGTVASPRSMRVAYKISAGTTDSVTFTASYGHIWALRGVNNIVQSDTYDANDSTVPTALITVPQLTSVGSGSVIICGGYGGRVATSVGSPYQLKEGTAGIITNSVGGTVAQNSLTYVATAAPLSYVIELNNV